MTQGYLGILFVFIIAVLNAAMLIMLSQMAGARRPTPVKDEPYESGIIPLGDTRRRFSVKFFVVAMLFIIFDVEMVFLFPWAVVFRQLGLFGLVEMFIFIGVLCAGLMYAWKKGALEWD